MFERFTEQARRVIFFARYEASQYGNSYIETEHLLLGLLRQDPFLQRKFPGKGDVQGKIRADIERHIVPGERISTSVEIPLSAESKQVLHLAMEESEKLGMRHIGTEHLLLALLSQEESPAAQLLHARGLTAATVRTHLAKAPESSSVSMPAVQDDKGKLMLESFLAGLKSDTAEDLIECFSQAAQFIDVFGKRWNRDEISKNFATLFAPYAKKNAAFLIEKTIADESRLFIASVLWRNAILASMQRVWLHRMSAVLTKEAGNWSILLLHVTAVQPE